MVQVEELIRALSERKVRFVAIGVWGVNLYARDAAHAFVTRDVDLLVPPDPPNLLEAWRACEVAGLELISGHEPLDIPRDLFLARAVVERRALTRATDGADLLVCQTIPMSLDRRSLLCAGAGLGPSVVLARALAAAGGARAEERFKISLAEWSLHRAIRAGELDPRDFAPFAREEYGLDAVEHVNTFFQGHATDFEYLTDMKRRADDAGVRSLLVMCDGEGELGDADEAARRRAVENHFRWIAAACFLGCHSIRVNADGQGSAEEVSKRVADSLHRLGEMGERYDVHVLVENHGGYSSNGAWLAATIRAADHPRAGTLPDFGNFRVSASEEYDRYRGVAELMPFARAVSAKSHDFDDAGNETHTDYAKMLGIVLAAGYRGYVGIEYEGERVSEREGIRLTKALLERVRSELGD